MRKAMGCVFAALVATLLVAVVGFAHVLGWAIARLLDAVGL